MLEDTYKSSSASRQPPLRNLALRFIKLVNISTERLPRVGGPLPMHIPWGHKAVPPWFLPSLSFAWHKVLPTWCSPSAESVLTCPGARAATAELVGHVLFLCYFGTQLFSFFSSAVESPCQSALGGPAPLSIFSHVGFSFVSSHEDFVGHISSRPRCEFLTQLRLLVSFCLYHKVSK